ncbi:MAG: SDR family oxidoreductase [Opitutales bacterium]
MDIAIVTGAETPLGLRIVQTLVQQGCRVHGIGNNFSKVIYSDPQFRAHPVDLTSIEAVSAVLGEILEAEGRLHLLVHAIDVTPGAAFEKLPIGNLEAILKIGLLGPVMMTRLALPNLLRFRGQLINVIPANKSGLPASALNSLLEGGLREMNKALFDQGRDAGLRITNCVLRQNTKLPGPKVSDSVLEQSHIDLEDVARTIAQLIDPKAVNVPAEVVLYPRLSSDAEAAMPDAPLPLDPYSEVVLPAKEYNPPRQPKIPTAQKQQIERTIPYSDEEMEDKIAAAIEDFEANPERYEQSAPKPQANPQQEGQGKNKRRRRRGGRNRNRKPGGESSGEGNPQPDQGPPKQEQVKERSERPAQKENSAGAKSNPAPVLEDREKPVKKVAKKASKKTAKKSAAKKASKKTVKEAVKKQAAKKSAKKKTTKRALGETANKTEPTGT